MSHPQTREEAAAAHAAWKARQSQPVEYLSAELGSTPTAWQSVPKPVRFAVWVWAVVMIVATASFIAGLALWIVTAGAVLATM